MGRGEQQIDGETNKDRDRRLIETDKDRQKTEADVMRRCKTDGEEIQSSHRIVTNTLRLAGGTQTWKAQYWVGHHTVWVSDPPSVAMKSG